MTSIDGVPHGRDETAMAIYTSQLHLYRDQGCCQNVMGPIPSCIHRCKTLLRSVVVDGACTESRPSTTPVTWREGLRRHTPHGADPDASTTRPTQRGTTVQWAAAP